MSETPLVKFRLGPPTLASLDALAASNGGNRSHALRESITIFEAVLHHAAIKNVEELQPHEWLQLWHLREAGCISDGSVVYWPEWLASRLRARAKGCPVEESRAIKDLARKVAAFDQVRGFAVFCALRWVWRHPETSEIWWHPNVWMATNGN